MNWRRLLTTSLLALSLANAVAAEPTAVTVRVISKGAKFIGSSMGGVQVLIRDADTGELLATGVTQGDTGDTARIMKEPRAANTPLSTEGAAKFTAELDLDKPRRIEVTALGPLAQRQSANRVSATQWVVPGHPVDKGDALMLEMPGLVVDVLAPPAHASFKRPREIELHANVTMMCGCPLGPETPWKVEAFIVKAVVMRDGRKVAELPLTYAGSPSQFKANYQAKEPGTYETTVYAHQPANGNTGVDHVTWLVQ